MWVLYACLAAILCATCNALLSELSVLGFEGLLYLQPGSFAMGVIYFLYVMYKNKQKTGNCGVIEMNIIVGGRFSCEHFLWFIFYCLIYVSF